MREAASQARAKLIAMAIADQVTSGASIDDVTVDNGWVISRATHRRDPAAAIIAQRRQTDRSHGDHQARR